MISTLVGLLSGFILIFRNWYPQAVFFFSCALVVIFPFDPLIALMALSSLLARRKERNLSIVAVSVATLVSIYGHLRDAWQPAEASLWHLYFAKQGTADPEHSNHMVVLAGNGTIRATAVIVALLAATTATLIGLHIRSRAILRVADSKVDDAQGDLQTLQTNLNNKQLSDIIAAEAHDTLAHSLSIIALNANVLQTLTK